MKRSHGPHFLTVKYFAAKVAKKIEINERFEEN